ncbi:hypothetical protein A1O1_05380 [Capronia coronata CBS 617.96]|uniref:C3H1-type domain-containing protein n=1 Tax=Capronia coronata CBS 617.96 TaxID=1182541 RepID=W9YFL6_9EURO|nr:uncharacterized protein A1O1_05380 [Capronia coronata CBS 617.96]EXJ88450.1 hypothetical protein A1O1_05380 [Capronia coronata CBS 617.96]
MSTQPFSFPPPPPPPPKRNTQGPPQQSNGFQNNRGSFRGGHSFRASTRGGRGGYGGGQHASFNAAYNPPGGYQRPPARPFDNAARRGSFMNGPQKRDHAAAFNTATQTRPRPVAPPPVPSFNASIEHLLPRKETPETRGEIAPTSAPAPKPRKQNLLGLTPASVDQTSDSEDDEGEEERLAAQIKSSGQTLQFEYRGSVATLGSPEEIAAWIAERKRRYPTKAKVEAAKKEAAEKKRKWEEEKQTRLDAKKEAWAQRDQERKELEKARVQKRELEQQKKEQQALENGTTLDPAALAKSKAEKLQKRALKAERQLAKAKEALRLAMADAQASGNQDATNPQPSDNTATDSKAAGSELHADSVGPRLSDPEYTSSSGSSETDTDSEDDSVSNEVSDSDSAPEVVSTKQAARAVDHTTLPPTKRTIPPSRPCKNMLKYGRCKFGARCRFSHERPKDSVDGGKNLDNAKTDARGKKKDSSSQASGNKRRKGLFQLMVEKEQEEERRRLLEAIITLGENCLLDEPATTASAGG